MKDVVKLFWILIIGLISAIFCYPFLHELGHVVAIILTGAELVEFCVLPIPYVVCNMRSINRIGQCLIGVAGMLFPFLISFFISRKSFLIWFFALVIKGVSALSFIISYLAVLCYESGVVWANEDIVKVVWASKYQSSIWAVFSLIMFCFSVGVLYFEKPIERFKNYFEV